MKRAAVAIATCLASLGPVVSACSDDAVVTPCTDIPPGGCPQSRGVACEDPACEAVYACRPGNVWELERRCPPREGGGPRDASTPEAEAAAPLDASIDAPPGAFGGPGCGVLQTPDCPLGLALACAPSCCDCEDLFVCEGGGWSFWGTCDAGRIEPADP